jgi:hypothetical protein
MSTDELTIEINTISQQDLISSENTRIKKIQYLKNQINTRKFAIMDKKNPRFETTCAKIAKKLVS